jgi:hypothetical protein
MTAVWLVLYLGSLVHLLALNGYGLAQPASLVVLVPLAAVFLLPSIVRRRPEFLPSVLLRGAGLLGFACTIVFVKTVHLDAWDTRAWGPCLAAAGAGLGSLLPALASSGPAGTGTWLWIAFWLGTGIIDPALPLLGAGLYGMLEGSGLGVEERAPLAIAPPSHPWLTLFLLGMALPNPWWDYGIEREWAWASASVGLGAALASLGFIQSRLSRLPAALPALFLGLLAILYMPALGVPWGIILGIALGAAWVRLPRPLPMDRAAAAFLAGLLISFTLHANAWIPGLRHLIWLGN